MKKRTGVLLGLGMTAFMMLQPMSVRANELTEYPTILEVKDQKEWETPSGISSEEFEEICDEQFEDAIGKNMAGGAVAIISDGKVVFSKGYGYADMENQIPFSPSETIFEYGSVSKLFTWTSAMQMEEQGKLDLNENIDDYLKTDFQRVNDKNEPLTMLQLMNHQAGYDDYLIHLMSRDEDGLVSLEAGLEEHKVSQIYEPGFATSYSNYGAALAGLVVENVAEEPLYQYVENEIFEPLGMTQTKMNPNLEDAYKNRKSKAYKVHKDGLEEGEWSYVSMYPAGSVNGTLDDLTKFAIAYLEKNPAIFQKEDTFDKMLSPSYEIAPGVEGIAHGFIEYDGQYPVFWHNGNTENFSTFFAIVPEADFAIVACGNTENAMSTIQPFGFSILQKQEVKIDEPQDNLPDITMLEGDYKGFREAHHGITQIISLFQNAIHVEVIGENQICIEGEKYVQIEPYVFQSLETGRKCGFLVENGKVVKYSQMLDYLPVPWTVQFRNLATYGVVFLFLAIFVVTWIGFLVDLLRKRKNPMHKFFLMENGILAVIILNIVVIMEKIAAWQMAKEFVGYRIGNCMMAVLLSMVTSVGIVVTRKEKEKGSWMYRIYAIVLLLLLCFATGWGLFSVIDG